MDDALKGKSVVITGAFGALGHAVAEAVLAAGAEVSAVDYLDPSRAPAFTAGIKPWGSVDLGEPAATVKAFDAIAQFMGGIDGLVNVAGAFRFETIAEGSIDTWDLLYRTNLRTVVNATKSALPHLLNRTAQRKAGRVINIGAAAANSAGLGMGSYAASKAGVARFTEALAAELKDRGITANAIQPSIIDTAANRAAMPTAEFDRWVKPQQIADLIVFLLSDKAGAITGASIPVLGRV